MIEIKVVNQEFLDFFKEEFIEKIRRFDNEANILPPSKINQIEVIEDGTKI